MDPTSGVESCIERTLAKFSNFAESYTASLESMKNHIDKLDRELLTGPECERESELSVTAVMIWEQAIKKLREILQQMGTEHRDMHGGVSKCGKEIDKTFCSDFTSVCRNDQSYESDPEMKEKINSLIAEHFLTTGDLGIAELFAKESGVDLEAKNKSVFIEVNSIIESLKAKDLEPALCWTIAHSEELRARDSQLEFSLRKLKFIELLKQGSEKQAQLLEYAKNFSSYATQHQKEIQTLMGAMLYLGQGVEKSPYSSLLDDIHWVEISDLFTREACLLLDLPVQSPLSIILNAGTHALPALLNLCQVMQARQVMSVWGQNDELPIEIDLGGEHRYHSVFACPILRQQTSEANPPMRLTCGHVISKEALTKLASNNRLKCPYCPTESTLSEAKKVIF